MSRPGQTMVLAALSRRLAWPVLGLWVLLGYLGFEANHHWHRHVSEGVVQAHDHLSAGPHRHQDDDAPDGSQEPRPPDPGGKDGYLGQASIQLLLDTGHGHQLQAALTYRADQQRPDDIPKLERDCSPRSPRGPPPPSVVIV